MAIKDWPSAERPRERLLKHGARALSEAELLALVIGAGTREYDAVQLARGALTTAGSLRTLCGLEARRFCRIKGLGEARYCVMQAALELARRCLFESLAERPAVTDHRAAVDYLKAELSAEAREVFGCLFLDNRHRVIAYEALFYGTIDSAAVHPREVVKRALELNAAALILAHNHPSGVAEPSAADQALTRSLTRALKMLEIRVLDHIVVAGSASASLAALGLLD